MIALYCSLLPTTARQQKTCSDHLDDVDYMLTLGTAAGAPYEPVALHSSGGTQLDSMKVGGEMPLGPSMSRGILDTRMQTCLSLLTGF